LLSEGGYDAVMLNEKFAQYEEKPGGGGYWLGSSWCPDVSRCVGDSSAFSAQPDSYGFANYVDGWVALARDLEAAGVPYMVRLIPNPWLRSADDPSTDFQEFSRIKSVLKGALLVMLDAANTGSGLSIEDWTRQLRASGVRVLPIDSRCGYAKEAGSD
jgi:hypothetical protein